MLQLCALHSDIGLLNAGGLQLRLRLGHIGFGRRASFEAIDRKLQRVPVAFHGVVQKLLLCIRAAQLEVVQRQVGMQAEVYCLQIAGGGLRFLACRRDGPAHTTPHVHFIRQIERQHKISGVVGRWEIRPVRRITDDRDAGSGRNCRKFRRPVETNQGPCLAEPRFGYFQVLIGNCNLFFQRIELRVAEDFPPVSTIDLVAGLRSLPSIELFECVCGRHRHRGFSVSWSNRAACEQCQHYRKKQESERFHCCEPPVA